MRFSVTILETMICGADVSQDSRVISGVSISKARRIERHFMRKAYRLGLAVTPSNWGFSAATHGLNSSVTIRAI